MDATDQNDSPELSNPEWVCDVYFTTLSQEKSSSLNELNNGTNWGITILAASLGLVLARNGFPDRVSLYILVITLTVGSHFLIRTLKGYINVIRWALLQRAIISQQVENETVELPSLISQYHLNWLLPLKRSDVFQKGILDLGYAYILGLLIIAIFFTLLSISPTWFDWAWILSATILIAIEVMRFLRSPYMRNVAVSENARSFR